MPITPLEKGGGIENLVCVYNQCEKEGKREKEGENPHNAHINIVGMNWDRPLLLAGSLLINSLLLPLFS